MRHVEIPASARRKSKLHDKLGVDTIEAGAGVQDGKVAELPGFGETQTNICAGIARRRLCVAR